MSIKNIRWLPQAANYIFVIVILLIYANIALTLLVKTR